MPTLSMFYGIIIRMQNEKGGRHHKPHIHVLCGDDELVMALDGEILEGNIPKGKLKLLQTWFNLHKDELYANWKLLNDGDRYFQIDPLK